jgi:hypothetical protein
MERVFRLGISGSYGGMNLGDKAILRAARAESRRVVPECVLDVCAAMTMGRLQ